VRATVGRRSWIRRPDPWFVRLLAVVLCVHVAVNLIRPMVSYRVLELGVPARYLGLVSASFALLPLAVGILVGRRIDRLGPRRFQLSGAALLAASGLGLGFVDQVGGIVALFAVCGLGHLLAMVAAQTTIANESADDTLDRRFGLFAFVAAVGQLVGPLLGGLVAGAVGPDGTRWALLVAGVVAGFALPPAAAIPARVGRSAAHGSPAEAEAARDDGLRSLFTQRGLFASLLVSFIVIATSDILIVYLPALGEERGLSVQEVSALLAVRAAATMLSRIGLGWIVDRVGRIRLLLVAVLTAGIAVATLPFTSSMATAIPSMFVAGFALGLCQPLTMAWVATQTSADRRGTAMSVRLTANRLGQVTVPAAAGLMAGFAGTAGVLWVVGGAIVATGLAVRRAL
jgi:MFS family permease